MMYKYDYSNELANFVKQYLEDDEWNAFFNEKTGVFCFELRIPSKIQKINYMVCIHKKYIVVYGVCPIYADDIEVKKHMVEFICRANYGLKSGCFEMDYRDGEIRYRCFMDCEGGTPSVEVLKNSIYCIAAMYMRYSSGVVDIVYFGSSAKDAIERCEMNLEEEIQSIISEMVGKDMEDIEADDVIELFAERLASEAESENYLQRINELL